MPDSPTDTQAIFDVARQILAEDVRRAYLEQVCRDSAMRKQVDALLEADDEDGDFLQGPAVPIDLHDTRTALGTIGAGDQIGPYKLLQRLGEGGMGVVFLAEQAKPVRRQVAVKVIKPDFGSRRVIARFEAERQALAMMDHPNIARVFDAGTTDAGFPYFAMELVKGLPITDYCDQHHLSTRGRLVLFREVCLAVQHAHQKGIIHRDLKPSNVLVADYDDHAVPKIIDFGLAKATERRLTDKTMFTEIGAVVGTVEYMSPEQAKLNQLDIDTRSDVYSLGVLLYELLSGETPFSRQRLKEVALDEMLRMIREEEPSRPSIKIASSMSLPSVAANRGVDPRRLTTLVRGELDWIVMRSLEKERKRRYQTAADFAEDIGHYLDDEPVEACPPSVLYRLRKSARRHKVMVAATMAVATALLAGLVGTAWQAKLARLERDAAKVAQTDAESARASEASLRTTAEQQRDRAVQAEQAAARAAAQERQQAALAKSERERALEQEIIARRNLYAADMNLAQLAYQQRDMPRARELLARHVPLADEPDWRSFEWHYLLGLCSREELAISGYGIPSFSADSKWIAVQASKNRLDIWNLEQQERERSIDGAAEDAPVIFAPHRDMVASVSDDSIHLWDANDGSLLRRFGSFDRPAQFMEFSPDGSRLICITSGDLDNKDIAAIVYVFDPETGDELLKMENNQGYAKCYACSPDGRQLIVHGSIGDDGPRETIVYDLNTGEMLPRDIADLTRAVAWSPDGQLIATRADRSDVVVTSLDDSTVVMRFSTGGNVDWIDFSPNGELLAAACENSETYVYDLRRRKLIHTLRGHSQRLFFAKFSPDSKRLLTRSRDGTVRVWSLVQSDPVAPISRWLAPEKLRSFEENHSQFSTIGGDGRWFAGRGSWTTARVVDARTGDVLHDWNIGHKITGLTGSGERLAVGHETGLQLWDVSNDERVASLDTGSSVASAVFSPDRNRVAVHRGHESALICDGASLSVTHEIDLIDGKKPQQLRELLFSPCGKWFAALTVDRGEVAIDRGKGRLGLWSTETWKKLWARSVEYHPQDICFSPDGTELAVGYGERWQTYDGARVKAWDSKSGRELWDFVTGGAICMAFDYCPDGKTLATANELGVIALWDRETREQRLKFKTDNPPGYNIYNASIVSMHFTPDGASILANNSLGQVGLLTSASEVDARRFEQMSQDRRLNDLRRDGRWTRILEALERNEARRAEGVYLADRAQALAESGQANEALVEYGKLVELTPEDATRWRMLAFAHLALGDRDQFQKTCLEIQDRFAETNGLSNALHSLSALTVAPIPELSEPTLMRLAELIDDQGVRAADSSWLRGAAYLRCGRYGLASELLLRADEQYSKIAESGTNRIENSFLLAILSLKVKLVDEAVRWLQRAETRYAALHPQGGEAGSLVSWYDKVVIEQFRREVEDLRGRQDPTEPSSNPNRPRSAHESDSEYLLARAYLARHKNDMATFGSMLDRAAACASDRPDPLLIRARLRLDQKDFVGSAEDFLAATKLCTRNADIAADLDNVVRCVKALKYSRDDYELVLELMRSTIDLMPEEEQLYFSLAALLKIHGHYDEALQNAELALQHGGARDWSRWTMKAAVLSEAGRHQEAIEICNRTLSLAPDGFWTYQVRALARERTGDLTGAIDDFVQSIRVGAGDWANGELIRLCAIAVVDDDPSTQPLTFEALEALINFGELVNQKDAWRHFATFLIAGERSSDYQTFCRQLVESHGGTDDPELAAAVAEAITIGPKGLESWEAIGPLLESLPEDHWVPRCQLLLRAGDLERLQNEWRSEEALSSNDLGYKALHGLIAVAKGDLQVASQMRDTVMQGLLDPEQDLSFPASLTLWKRELDAALDEVR